jgi:hypothetical protein
MRYRFPLRCVVMLPWPVQSGMIKANGATFNPSGAFTRLDLAHAMSKLAGMPLQ